MRSDDRHAFTLIELLVVIAIIAILAAILFPIIVSAKDRAKQSQCLAHCKQIAAGIVLYADDNDGWIVKSANPVVPWVMWPQLLSPYFKGKGIHMCPSRSRPPYRNSFYEYYPWGIGLNHPNICGYWDSERKRLSQIRYPSATVVGGDVGHIRNPHAVPDEWVEGCPSWIFRTPVNDPYYSDYAGGGADRIVGRHNGMAAVVFLDGHASSVKVSQLGFQYPERHPLCKWDIY